LAFDLDNFLLFLPKQFLIMQFPENLKYTKEHEWVALDGDIATIGITEFAQQELGDIVYVEIETVGSTLEADEVFGTVEAVKTVSDLFLPLAGTVTELNADLETKPENVNSDPYGSGWMVKVKVNNPEDFNQLMDTAAYKDLIGE